MMENKRIFGLVLFILLCFCVFSTTSKVMAADSNSLLEPSVATKFRDIAVPSGFVLQAKESYSFENTGVRVAVLKYRGKAPSEQLIGFFKEQMAMNNWNLLNVIEFGERLLNFDRPDETCTISLKGNGKYITYITISIGPKSPNMPKKAVKEPLK